MTDPEIEHARLVSGDAGLLRQRAATLEEAAHALTGARSDVADAQDVVVWDGSGAVAFDARMSTLRNGITLTRTTVERARGALETAADAYTTAESHADHYIGFWRNRPSGLPPVVEEIFARVVNAFLVGVGVDYNRQLAAVSSVLTGEEVDLDDLDEETREWVEEGLRKNEEWLAGNDSGLGPIIPNTAASGDDRGWIPQGLGYDPDSRTLVQSYYTEDGTSYLALIDEVTGKKVGEVRLGGDFPVPEGSSATPDRPNHAGGVSVQGDHVYVVDNGKLFTYSLRDLRGGTADDEVDPVRPPQDVRGGSYSAMHDGRLYLGDFENDVLHVYEKRGGDWVEVDSVETPNQCQGVVVRDGQYVFSSSYGRGNESSLIVQDADTGDRSKPYVMPNMAEGIVEVDGDVITTYESGAGAYQEADGTSGWWWGLDDNRDLWPSTHMTRTPLSDLGIGQDLEIEPGSLTGAAADLGAPADALAREASTLGSLRVPSHALGRVPAAAGLAREIDELVETAGDSLRTGSSAVAAAAELLVATANDHTRVDDHVGSAFRGATPLP
ncbi:hypothetical protein L2K70_09585 [Nocardioides KLBMP 9356]|uniref:Uncharacterized protein n=1 Tax=Nocardioides potassii TaxID=2911371 RepID=A0ABS9HCL4_9ACTN|nr:hypothetical protein [Nocardioides potassii]MCF6377856.1 hypothetical protein [Nocardioides potassii]